MPSSRARACPSEKASARIAEFLEKAGFKVERGYRGVETSYRGDAAGKNGGPRVAILAEYDALAELGHGCGHNLIAMIGTGAAVAVRENQRVRAGDELFQIDDRPHRIALAGADAELAAVATELDSIKASLRQQTEELRLAHTNRDFAARENPPTCPSTKGGSEAAGS